MRSPLETAVARYEDIPDWRLPRIEEFSDGKKLWDYQVNAVKAITKTLHLAFGNGGDSPDKRALARIYKEHDFDISQFDKPKTLGNYPRHRANPEWQFFCEYFPPAKSDETINGENFLNRACMWMATGSGKSLVIIKTIELLDFLMFRGLIPVKEIMLLLPRDDLIRQFSAEIDEYNLDRQRKIDLVSLSRYEESKETLNVCGIRVYYYRSDLLRTVRKEKLLDFKSYDNFGNWYLILDEAHRGEKGDAEKNYSNMQRYLAVLSRNGFLFNFSATFTDTLDLATTCFNFNLQKWTEAGYGKNIYLSKSYFDFEGGKHDELSEQDKQKQILRSFVTFTMIKGRRQKGMYHAPLMVTYVNSINTKEADLKLFFAEMEKISSGKIKLRLFQDVKDELTQEYLNNPRFIFGGEQLKVEAQWIDCLSVEDVQEALFNTRDKGAIEWWEGEADKEIVLKLQTAQIPFGLIRIGSAKEWSKDVLGAGYTKITPPEKKNNFSLINKSDDITLLMGSRAFYEGWDSNRPNVINLINIGGKDAQKFVPQAIGRGLRIEPVSGGERKRFPVGDKRKDFLLETLFIFATDKKSISAILAKLDVKRSGGYILGELQFEETSRAFDLLIPVYEESGSRDSYAKFSVAAGVRNAVQSFARERAANIVLLNEVIKMDELDLLLGGIESGDLFQIDESARYEDIEALFARLVAHIEIRRQNISGVKTRADEIIHFKHIRVFKTADFNEGNMETLKAAVERVRNWQGISEEELDRQFDAGEISREAYKTALKAAQKQSQSETVQDLTITHLAEHYYLPVIYSLKEKADYITHIIKHTSEVDFIKKLEAHTARRHTATAGAADWMFSKIDEALDTQMGMPYFDGGSYRHFYPDFIFWVNRGRDYHIYFVDPKGSVAAAYQKKADDFARMFEDENGKPKVFKKDRFEVRFSLVFIGDPNSVSSAYKRYWQKADDFLSVISSIS